jgi:hypothetical protein
MKLEMKAVPQEVVDFCDVQVGNVYRTQKKLYVIISIIEKDSPCGNNAAAFAVDPSGNIEGVVSYTTYYFARQKLVGFAHIPQVIEVDWF